MIIFIYLLPVILIFIYEIVSRALRRILCLTKSFISFLYLVPCAGLFFCVYYSPILPIFILISKYVISSALIFISQIILFVSVSVSWWFLSLLPIFEGSIRVNAKISFLQLFFGRGYLSFSRY